MYTMALQILLYFNKSRLSYHYANYKLKSKFKKPISVILRISSLIRVVITDLLNLNKEMALSIYAFHKCSLVEKVSKLIRLIQTMP